jgi:predicted metal-dependent enzyme (double-stranded beta helix superfamily)
MTEFDRFLARIRDLVVTAQGHELEAAQAVRTVAQHALSNDAFIRSCAERIIASVETAGSSWRNPALHQDVELPLQLRVFYWPPGQKSEPHFHAKWTVTGVLYNEIAVETFESDQDVAMDRPAKKFAAKMREVGYLLPPCIHRLSNTTSGNSATLHIFSEGGTEARRADPPKWPAQLKNEAGSVASPLVQRALHVVTSLLAATEDAASPELLVRIFAIAAPRVQMHVIKTLIPKDAELAYSLSRRLERTLSGDDREKLAAINHKFELACRFPSRPNVAAAAAGMA